MAGDAAPAPAPPVSRSLRIWYGVIQTVALAVFAVLCGITAKFEPIYAELGMTKLPAPTELFLAVAPFFRSAAGLLLLVAGDAALVSLGMAGRLDRVIRKLVVFNVIGTLGIVSFYVMAIFTPLIQIQETLRDK